MKCRVRHLLPALLLAAAAGGDVSYVAEVVNSGVGASQRGARRTVHEVAIKGARQRVSTDIETSKEVVQVLQKQGVPLQETRILLLDQNRLYDINRSTGTYRQRPLPAAKKPAVAPADTTAATTAAKAATPATAPAPAGKPVAPAASTPAPAPAKAEDPNRSISVRSKSFPDTTRVAGVLCQRVAVEMTARHTDPKTKKVARVNRYLYQAWMARDFPGYAEIVRFHALQEERTSMAPLLSGGLDQLRDVVDDPERLEGELASLQGFPMQSQLKVYSTIGTQKERLLMTLSTEVLQMSTASLSDTLFRPAKQFKSLP